MFFFFFFLELFDGGYLRGGRLKGNGYSNPYDYFENLIHPQRGFHKENFQ